MTNFTTIADVPWDLNPPLPNISFAKINADFTVKGQENNLAVYYKKIIDEFIYLATSGKMESIAKAWQGKRLFFFFLGEWRDLGEHAPKILNLALRYGFTVIAVPDTNTGWKVIETVLGGEPVPMQNITLPCPRLENIGGIQEKYWTLSHLQGTLKITSLKYIDIFWGEREGQPLPTVIAAEAPRYRYYGILYQDQNIPQDKPTIAALRAACESVGGMFRLTTEQKLRPDLHDFGQTLWGRFLADVNAQFNGGK